ncbi:hypothetical protein G7074_01825 [Pedobacter sp. HDW13]|uniref:hypothetical protein n=1 Tax=Pedobacter sp. HDW13 TaxID=2714940 RepID=UPI00140C504D|nr:hypothetical protein [Pedobacter sp. HDW13]QIL38123.1 hypothetical protein G7074_01825 [Pedobacter sp. HDW13]
MSIKNCLTKRPNRLKKPGLQLEEFDYKSKMKVKLQIKNTRHFVINLLDNLKNKFRHHLQKAKNKTELPGKNQANWVASQYQKCLLSNRNQV